MILPTISTKNDLSVRAGLLQSVTPQLPTHFKHVSHLPIGQRFNMVAKQAARAHKRGYKIWLSQLISRSLWQHLRPAKPLDGLSMYRQALAKVVVPPQINTANAKGKTILLISR